MTRWLEADRAGLHLHRQLTEAARQWQRQDHDDGILYRGARLEAAQEWMCQPGHRDDLNPLERRFLDSSTQAQTRRTRRTCTTIAALATLLLAALAATGAAVNYAEDAATAADNANRQHLLAVSRQLAAQSDALAAADPKLALLLATQGLRFAPSAEARYSVRNLLTPSSAPLVGHAGPVWGIAFSPDGSTVATASADKTARLWDLASHRQRGQPLTGDVTWVRAVAFSPDGKTLATASDDGETRLWSTATHRQLDPALRGTAFFGMRAVAFSPDGKTLATASDDETARLWDLASHRQLGQPLTGHAGPVYAVAYSPDGKTLATASDDGTARLWDLASHR